jgi:MerR family regulatory protein
MRCSKLAKRMGVSADTIRHYERLGLLKVPPRTAGGYREFEMILPEGMCTRRSFETGIKSFRKNGGDDETRTGDLCREQSNSQR